jgi:hypothetical protein
LVVLCYAIFCLKVESVWPLAKDAVFDIFELYISGV